MIEACVDISDVNSGSQDNIWKCYKESTSTCITNINGVFLDSSKSIKLKV